MCPIDSKHYTRLVELLVTTIYVALSDWIAERIDYHAAHNGLDVFIVDGIQRGLAADLTTARDQWLHRLTRVFDVEGVA
ncbi:hypothetical protein L1C91_03250 [Corynebacterium argentoratense]|nr:hypothetical protein [Corynebacterium argentoratense]